MKESDDNDDDYDNDDHHRHFQCVVKDLSIYLYYEKEEKR